MKHTYKVLKSDIELFAAALSQVKVYVVQPLGENLIDIVDYGGTVEKIILEWLDTYLIGNRTMFLSIFGNRDKNLYR
ncbi:hypothetical protein ABEW24_25635 [Paenibacillus jamilae]|uniref:hypothetical protein n=1 Tax=Paenibacillus TaxID=44249 RepID=UPI00077C993F|nr:hypothetical protein [Paenibacillus polymyxa]KYG94871.1 hypothetical protein AZE31_13750 [Paenibacillus polymyxa]